MSSNETRDKEHHTTLTSKYPKQTIYKSLNINQQIIPFTEYKERTYAKSLSSVLAQREKTMAKTRPQKVCQEGYHQQYASNEKGKIVLAYNEPR